MLQPLGTFAFAEATRIGLLSVVSVIATLNPVVTVVLAFVLLRERPAPVQRIGAALALLGIVLLAAGRVLRTIMSRATMRTCRSTVFPTSA